jgi:SAM-dependent methyltransferase
MRTLDSRSPFDRLATEYDRLWTHAPSGMAQRAAFWEASEPHLRASTHVLDLGCGTGTDARYLQAIGKRVAAIDSSPGMVREARAQGTDAEHCAIENIDRLQTHFDGAISNFGALNCVPSLPEIAEKLKERLLPGAPVALCLLGRFCIWEVIFYLLKGDFRKASRRFRGQTRSSLGLTVFYPSHAVVISAFRDHFRFIRWQAIGLCVPPSYVSVSPAAVKVLAWIDRALAKLPVLRAGADHRLYLFERV